MNLKQVLVLLLTVAVAGSCVSALPTRPRPVWEEIQSYICYYGPGQHEQMAKFDCAILMPWEHSKEELDELKNAGVWTIGYFNIGEAMLCVGDGMGAGGYASFFLDRRKTGHPEVNEVWKTCYVDAGSPAWREWTFTDILPFIFEEKGCDGIFLDMVDTAAAHAPYTAPGMIQLIKEIKRAYPDKLIVINRGEDLLEDLQEVIDGVMIENFSCIYDFNTQKSRRYRPDELVYSASIGMWINEFRKERKFPVFLLDFPDWEDEGFRAYFRKLSDELGFLPFATDISLTATGDKLTPMPPAGEQIGRFALDFPGFCAEYGIEYSDVKPVLNEENLALTATVKTSSMRQIRWILNDGIREERSPQYYQTFCSRQLPEIQWISLKLAERKAVRKVVIYWEKPSRKVTVDIQAKGNLLRDWQTLGEFEVNGPITEIEVPQDGEGQWIYAVRLRHKPGYGAEDYPDGWSIREIEIYE